MSFSRCLEASYLGRCLEHLTSAGAWNPQRTEGLNLGVLSIKVAQPSHSRKFKI